MIEKNIWIFFRKFSFVKYKGKFSKKKSKFFFSIISIFCAIHFFWQTLQNLEGPFAQYGAKNIWWRFDEWKLVIQTTPTPLESSICYKAYRENFLRKTRLVLCTIFEMWEYHTLAGVRISSQQAILFVECHPRIVFVLYRKIVPFFCSSQSLISILPTKKSRISDNVDSFFDFSTFGFGATSGSIQGKGISSGTSTGRPRWNDVWSATSYLI